MLPRKIAPIFAVLLLISVALASLAQAQGMPHAIIGVVTGPDGSPAANATVTLTNGRTNGIISITANNLGQYQADLSTMPSGYQAGDVISVRAVQGNLEGTSSVTVSGGPLDQCDVTVSEPPKDTPFPSAILLLAIVSMLSLIVAGLFSDKGQGPSGI